MNKKDLIAALRSSHDKIQDQLEIFDEQALIELTTSEGWSFKDIVAHLTRWEAELIKLLWQLRQGQRPTTVHFTGLIVDEVNDRWLAEDRSRPLDRILSDYQGVRSQTIRRVESFTDTELNDAQRFSWLEGKSLSEWVVEDTLEHDAEHLPQIEELISLRKSGGAGKNGSQVRSRRE